MRCVGETEFVNGVAAMSGERLYGTTRACAGIVGHADLRMGDAVARCSRRTSPPATAASAASAISPSYDADPECSAPCEPPGRPLPRREFREGFDSAAPRPLVRRMAARAAVPRPHRPRARLPRHAHRARPRRYAARASRPTPASARSASPIWRDEHPRRSRDARTSIVKLGGLAMAFCGFPSFDG